MLVVEGDASLREELRRSLGDAGFAVDAAPDGSSALQHVDHPPQALVLDVDLPDADGRDLRRALQALGCSGPTVFLTSPEALAERMAGARPGVDDYVTKPVRADEVVARLRTLLHDGNGAHGGELRLDPVSHAMTDGTTEVPLTPTEFRLLAALTAQRGRVVRRRDLVAAAWPEGAIVYDNTLDQYVARLRRKLRAMATDAQITTARGVGYRLG